MWVGESVLGGKRTAHGAISAAGAQQDGGCGVKGWGVRARRDDRPWWRDRRGSASGR